MSTDPRDKRLRVSILIEFEGANYVIDCGPDFRQQMLSNKVTHLEALLFTHEHADHTAGLDDIRPFFFRQGDIPIYAHQRVLDELKKRFEYIFETEKIFFGSIFLQIRAIPLKRRVPHCITNRIFFRVKKTTVPHPGVELEAAVHPPSVATKGFGCVDIRERVIVEAALAIEQGGVGGRVITDVRPRRNHAQNNINDLRRQGAIE